jgi:hypothetical protein
VIRRVYALAVACALELACAMGLVCVLGLVACGEPRTSCEEKWGLRAISLRPTLGGTMLDFRYQVVDETKARSLWDRKLQPYLFDPASGVALGMSEDGKLGSLRASMRNPPVTGKRYYVLFANGFGSVKHGSRVTVGLGDCKLENLRVD